MKKLPLLLSFSALLLLAILGPTLSLAADPPPAIKLYAFDVGHMHVNDMGFFTDTGEGSGQPGEAVVTSFLIRHPKGDLIWDTGLSDKLADLPNGMDAPNGFGHMSVPTRLRDQLQSIGVAPNEIEFLAFSHMHADHTGNANMFDKGTVWLLNQKELDFANSPGAPSEPASYSAYKSVKTQMIGFDYDVFGDGTVKILRTPGHTPGHQCLQLKLAKAGTVILSGDLYHTRRNEKEKLMPAFNWSRSDTLASFDRIARILKNTHGRLVIQHAPEDLAALPKLPKFLE